MKTKLYCSGLSYQTRPNAVAAADQYQLPRLALARLNQAFLPDYSLLLLVESLVMDHRTFEELVRGLIPQPGGAVLAIKALHDAGLVELVDFERIYRSAKAQVLGDLTIQLDAFRDWEGAVAESVESWRSFSNAVQENLRPKVQRLRQMAAHRGPDYSDLASNYLHDLAGRIQMVKFFAEDALPSSDPNVEVLPDTELFTKHLREHLLSALYSIAVARGLKAGFHEWTDAAPYYRKTLGTGNLPLFDLPLPEFSLWHPDKVVKALTSPAAVKLRGLVKDTLFGGQAWNENAAQQCLMKIAKVDQGIPSVRRVSACRKIAEAKAGTRPAAKRKIAEWWFISEALGSKPLAGG